MMKQEDETDVAARIVESEKSLNEFDNEQVLASPPPGETVTRTITGLKWVLLVAALLSSAFLFALDNSIVADVQPKIVETFPGSIDKLPWLSVAFALGGASTTLVWLVFELTFVGVPPCGRATVYSNFDAKYNYIVALFLFEVGSALCGAANIMDALIFGRVIAGLGGSGLYLGVLTILSSITTPQERPLYVASTGLTWGFGSVLGPVIGGSFADSPATWRWSFYINLVVAALFAPVYLFMVPSVKPKPGKSKVERVAGLDFVGSFLIIAGSACGVTGLSFGGSLFAWNTGTIIALLCLSIVLLVLFGIQQGFCLFTTFDRRLLPMQYFKSRTLILMFITSSMAGGPIFIPTYFIPLFFQFSKGDGALDAAVRILPFMFLLVFFSLLNGAAMGKYGHYKGWYIFATAMILIGSTLMFTVDEHTSTGRIYGYSVILGIGAGTIIQTGFIVAQAVVPRSEMSSAIAFINLAQIGGMVIALTLANTIFLNVAQKQIGAVLPGTSPEVIKSAISGTSSTFLRTLSLDTQAQVLHAVVGAIGKTYALGMTSGALGLILSICMKWEAVVLVL